MESKSLALVSRGTASESSAVGYPKHLYDVVVFVVPRSKQQRILMFALHVDLRRGTQERFGQTAMIRRVVPATAHEISIAVPHQRLIGNGTRHGIIATTDIRVRSRTSGSNG